MSNSEANALQLIWNIHGLKKIPYASDPNADTGDCGPDNCSNLADAVQTLRVSGDSLLNDLLIATSYGGRFPDAPPIVTLTLKYASDTKSLTDRVLDSSKEVPADAYTTLINKYLKKKCGAEVTAERRVSGILYSFDPPSIGNIERATASGGSANADLRVKSAYTELVQKSAPVNAQFSPADFPLASATRSYRHCTHVSNVPSHNVIDSFSIADHLAAHFVGTEKDVTDDDVLAYLKNIITSLSNIGTETNSSALINHMLASGIVTLGNDMWNAYLDKMKGSTVLTHEQLVPYLVTAVGGATVIAPIAQTISKAIGSLLLHPDRAKNLVLSINLTEAAFYFGGDAVPVGQRDFITPVLAKGSNTRMAVPCGLYVYSRNTPGIPRGPCIGITFHNDDYGSFAVGLSCVNTASGGENAVAVVPGPASLTDLANSAANKADDVDRPGNFRHTAHVILQGDDKVLSCVTRRCLTWGNWNMALSMMIEGKGPAKEDNTNAPRK